ncbi:MAG TPA: hypothetical protein VFS21_37605 [Roseiflexaceae bacterium]|nr:hypothetical protein [Roseiflexaceae bacterium]
MSIRLSHRVALGLLVILVVLACGAAPGGVVQAQSLPFTPTPAPTATPTSTTLPTSTPTPSATATPQVVTVVATPTAPSITASPAPTATPLPPGYGRDRCDLNPDLTRPCAVATETEITDLSFAQGPVDVFSMLLKGGRQYRITAATDAGGIDPSLEVFVADRAEAPLGANDDVTVGSPTAALTITVAADGWYLARVTNRAPGDPLGKVYRFSARSVAEVGAATPVASDPDDLIGNAYDPAHAVRIAWGVPYDLTLRCPERRPGACYDGRHTFLRLPVKRGIPLALLSYDLGLGVDTVLTLYRPDADQTAEGSGQLAGWRLVASNDDVVGGWTLRSQLIVIPDWSGEALLVVAPSERADLAVLPSDNDGRPGRYRLIAGPLALPAVKAVLAAQTDLPPTPTPRPTSQPAPAAVSTQPAQDTREVIRESCATGQAVVDEDDTPQTQP